MLIIEKIIRLKARYLRYLDTKRFSDLRALFTDDAQILFEGALPEWSAIEPAITVIRAALAEVNSVHHCHMPEIVITTPQSARAIWAMEDRLFTVELNSGKVTEHLHGFGHYHEDYVEREGAWYIQRLKLTRLAVWRPVEISGG